MGDADLQSDMTTELVRGEDQTSLHHGRITAILGKRLMRNSNSSSADYTSVYNSALSSDRTASLVAFPQWYHLIL